MSTLLVFVGLCVEVPQIIELISEIPAIANSIGPVTSPVQLPLQINLLIGLAAVIGSAERALRLRPNWIDELAS